MNNKNREYDLAEEMQKLQQAILEGKKENKKIKFKTFRRRTLQIIKVGVALAAIPTISSGILIAYGWNPYKLNEKEKDTCIVSYVDSFGTKSEYETNAEYRENEYIDCISYYDKWTKLDNGSYMRNIYKYEAKPDSMLTLMGMLQTPEEVDTESLKDLIIESLVTDIEVKDTITKEELEKGSYITGTYYDVNGEKTILVKETKSDHDSSFIGFIVINVLLMIIEFIILICGTYFFENIKAAFTDDLNLVDIDYLKGKLEKVIEELQNSIGSEPKEKKLS